MEIEKGMPIPKSNRSVLRDMEIGDSFFVERLGSFNFSTLRPLKFTMRKVEGGYRIWRIL